MRGSAVNSSKVNGPGSHRMGWLDWLAGLGWAGLGLQRADLSSAESFHALRPRPAGCGAAANKMRKDRNTEKLDSGNMESVA